MKVVKNQVKMLIVKDQIKNKKNKDLLYKIVLVAELQIILKTLLLVINLVSNNILKRKVIMNLNLYNWPIKLNRFKMKKIRSLMKTI